jgi:hypothetical protein
MLNVSAFTKHMGHRIVMQNLLKLGAKKDETYIAKGYAHLKKMR